MMMDCLKIGIFILLVQLYVTGAARQRTATNQETLCQLTRHNAKKASLALSCNADGSFKPKQCQKSECWCVNAIGEELPRSRVSKNSGGRQLNCVQSEKTLCQWKREKDLLVKENVPLLLGSDPVECKIDGKFVPTQCKGTECWCVNAIGDEVHNSRQTRRERSDCPELEKTTCQSKKETFLIEIEKLECD